MNRNILPGTGAVLVCAALLLVPSMCSAACEGTYTREYGPGPGTFATAETSRTYSAAADLLVHLISTDEYCSGAATKQQILDTCANDRCYVECLDSGFPMYEYIAHTDGWWEYYYTYKTYMLLDAGNWNVVCTPECTEDSDCPEGELCVDGVCETDTTDTDLDGIVDSSDNCPDTCNPEQLDADLDDIGDVCDQTPHCVDDPGCGLPMCEEQDQCDTDNDGIVDADDNCPDTCNAQQLDADEDGVGDVCDQTPHCVDDPGCGLTMCEEVCTP
jgi:hypothetical protein